MNSFLNKFSATTSQWRVLDAIARTLRTQSDLKLSEPPCITFKQVAYGVAHVPGSDLYRYRVTRDVGRGYFHAQGVGRFTLIVSCEQKYADYLPATEGAYLYELYVGFYTEGYGRRHYFKLEDLEGEPVQLEPTAEEIPFEMR